MYLDEFQHFVTNDIEELFTEGRKYGVRLTVAHQYRDKLPGYLQHATLTARTKIVFQPTLPDARELAPLFPVAAETTSDDINPRATRVLLDRTSDFPERVQQMQAWTYQELQLTNEPPSIGLQFLFGLLSKPLDPRHIWFDSIWYSPYASDAMSLLLT